ncbi:DMT family transporter [Rhodoferax sp. U2-2l]|uniref:DMT family transporter n=1 Tax=Rhodoferax sp. U2-2l TaxID=2884000 RepID=UPI001D0AD94D|nr:DMT family transporter [Rhodoferax sp. U2-2l]MCB8747076.1 DMT family transporter [Rhodoferax sp. U2-2l]
MQLNRKQLVLLALLTLVWGFNWPVMKLGVTDFPPLTFRSLCLWLGLPVVVAVMVTRKLPFKVSRQDYREVFWLAMTNLVIWNVLIILAIKYLSSGRSAILGYTMPIFSALLGAWFFGTRLRLRNWIGVAAAALGVGLLLWNEMANLSGQPLAVLGALAAAATWAYGTQLMRNTRLVVPTLTLAFWMMLITALTMTVLCVALEYPQWQMPSGRTWFAIAYNAVLVFGFAQAVWLTLARTLPPIASTLSVMMIPILGVFSGALGLGEQLHWQDWTAVGLMVVSMVSVLAPSRAMAKA